MKVLLYSDFFLSGQTTHVLELAKQLQKLKIDVHIAFGTIHSKLFRSHYVPYLENNGIPFSERCDTLKVFSLALKFKPDLIHCQSSTLFKNTQTVASRLAIPYILTCHGLGFNQPKYHSFFSSASAIIAIGPRVAKEVADFQDKTVIIANGIDTDVFSPSTEDNRRWRKKIMYVGRLEKKRIIALQQLIKAHTAISSQPLTIVSNWNPNLSGTNFQPWQVDLVPHLQSSGIVIACGRTAREALSCGNAVLLMQEAYDGVISPQLITKPDFDFSGNLERFPFSFIERDLRRLLKSNLRLKKLQSWGRNYALNHLSSTEMAKNTVLLYQKVLKSNHSRARYSLWPPL